ncbi:ABC transporter permease [Deinococcus maricopensis]|uniref:ABC transporter permease n=1 Tax=Deinococcus maricopensis (strain DSM 21211 / LMG 22137 / NRRL B-23946 / LB-34) TaxID=709986 RepID=E8UAY1_DEIML|nr:ABC transporter permease [Deinococcus maricopensis]ADV68220.1 hypothetical protein Deima_2587 [Deinococcus maricopensis DSM 21211]
MRGALLVAGLTLREALRKRLVVALLILTAIFIGFYLYGVFRLESTLLARAAELGLDRAPRAAQRSYAFMTLLGMYLVNFLASLMAVLSAVGSVSGDIESGVMQSIAYRPVPREQYVLGRWLGFALINAGYVVLLSVGLLFGTHLITGFLPPDPVPAVALMVLSTLLLLTLTVLGSSVFTTLASGIGVFLLYGIGWTGGFLKTLGVATDAPTLTRLGHVASVLMPADDLWKGASNYLLTEEIRQVLNLSGGFIPFFGTQPPSVGTLLWTAAYMLLALVLACLAFRRRDL